MGIGIIYLNTASMWVSVNLSEKKKVLQEQNLPYLGWE